MSEAHKNSRLNELEIEKKELEIKKIKQEHEKINLEIKELKKSSFTKTNWPSILIPLSFTIVPVVYLLLSGIFDSKYQEYKANKASLEYDQKKFGDTRDAINLEISDVKNTLKLKQDSLISIKDMFSLKKDSLNNISESLNLYKKNIKELETIKASLNRNIESKDKILADLLVQKQKIQQEMVDTINNFTKSKFILETTITSMGMGKIYYEKRLSILKSEIEFEKIKCEAKLNQQKNNFVKTLFSKDSIINRRDQQITTLKEKN